MKTESRSLDLITKKNKFARAAHFFLISKKTNLHVSTLFIFLCRCFARLQCRFVRLKRQNSQLHIIFMEELSYVLTKVFVSCVHVRCYSFTAAHFHLVASISYFLTIALKFSCFQRSTKFVSLALSLFFTCVNIKNNVEKDTTLLGFFLSKSPGGHAIFFRCIWVAIPVDRVILYWCTCGADGRSVGWAVYGHVITILSRKGRFTQLWASARPWSSAI